MRHHIAGVENAGGENAGADAGVEFTRLENTTLTPVNLAEPLPTHASSRKLLHQLLH